MFGGKWDENVYILHTFLKMFYNNIVIIGNDGDLLELANVLASKQYKCAEYKYFGFINKSFFMKRNYQQILIV